MTTGTATSALTDMMSTLRHVHASGRTRSVEWRLSQLRAVRRFCQERESEIFAAIAADLGREAFDSWLGEIAGSMGEVDFAIKNLKRWMRPKGQKLPLAQRPGKAWVQYEPLGVVLVVAPWNYPVFLALGPIIGAVAAGNCVVLKPSELAPATSSMLATLLPQYLDPEAVQVVEGDGLLTQELLSLGFDHALFTGGTEIGRKVLAGAAPTLTPVTLELGGKSPVIVTADADLAVVARRIAWFKILNSGQTCIAPDYVLVDEVVKDRLVDELQRAMADQRRHATGGLKIVNDRQFARLVGYLDATTAKVATGGGADPSALTLEPTILVDPDPDEPSMQEEIFGPILPVRGFRSIDEAVTFVTGRPKPLALYVFTKDRRLAQRLIDTIPAGAAVVNHIALHCVTPSLPFGGVGASGMGAYHGEWGFQALSHRKAVMRRPLKPDPSFMYPPHSERAQKLLRKIL